MSIIGPASDWASVASNSTIDARVDLKSTFVHAVKDLGCTPLRAGTTPVSSSANLARFTDWETRIDRTLVFPAEPIGIDQPLELPAREGLSVQGLGGVPIRALAECCYDVGGSCSAYETGGAVSRLVALSPMAYMVALNGPGVVWDRVSLQGQYSASNSNTVQSSINYALGATLGMYLPSVSDPPSGENQITNIGFHALKNGFQAGECYETGTVSITAGVVTLSGGTWPSWAAEGNLVIAYSSKAGTSFPVNTRNSNTSITLNDTGISGISNATYRLIHYENDQADNTHFKNVQAGWTRTLFRLFGQNSVNFTVDGFHGTAVTTYFDVHGAGQLDVRGGRLQGESPTLLYMEQGNLNASRFNFHSIHVDANNIGQFWWVRMPAGISAGGSQCSINFYDPSHDKHSQTMPNWELRGCACVRINGGYGFENNCLELHSLAATTWGGQASVTPTPRVFFNETVWSDDTIDHTPANSLHPNTDGAHIVRWRNNTTYSGKNIADGSLDT